MGLIFKDVIAGFRLESLTEMPWPHCKFQRINKRMGDGFPDGREKPQHSTAWEARCKSTSAHPEQLHVLSPAEDLSLGAEGDPIQVKDTAWTGQNDGNKSWSLLPGGSREALLVWLSCLGDASALSWQPDTLYPISAWPGAGRPCSGLLL